jgi:hypothetical protein
MAQHDIALTAHLLRRAGFGAPRKELERYAANGYEATVEELLHPENGPSALEDEDLIRRYHVDENSLMLLESCQTYWLYRMINTRRPLEEKIALFWHGVFATGYTKLNHPKAILRQVDMFRRYGLGSFRTLLVKLSRDPAMLFWLDNKDNHRDAVNENYGRELLELFSMGVGNYTERDVRQCSHAFTGWTIHNASLHTGGWRETRYGPMDASIGNLSTMPMTTTPATRPSLSIPGLLTAKRSSTSSVGSQLLPDLSPAIYTTSSSPTSHRCRPGPPFPPVTRRRSLP